ncbi:HlyD family efflux transporter periplasmic adaptor subunit [Moheibacter sediminis]|uniref:HlyD family secretion protein n=1 Tax=Moheibacter sediminis TaxID=1434700 RepID=A0A1W2D1N8_9FLAO|nr:HlyD family secretion protein [Moheibacter sediminis]SMC90918.1 HlyD family secretion protein [Moheibacter sediminis]
MSEKIEEIQNRSESLQEIMSNPPKWIIRWGLFIIFSILIMFIIACFFIKYPETITSNVSIKSTQSIAVIDAKKSGTIDSIFVKNHDRVSKEQVVGNLKSTAEYNDIKVLKNLLEKVQYDANVFYFPIEQTQNLTLGEIKSKYVLFARAYEEMKKNPQDVTRYIVLIQTYDDLKFALADWEKLYLLKSEIDGEIHFNKYLVKGQFIKSQEVLFVISPNNYNSLYAVGSVSSQDKDKISPSQKVHIKLANFPFQQYGLIEGRVKTIDSKPDSNGKYAVEISLVNDLKTSANYDLQYNSEMIGTAEIITEDIKLIDRILNNFKPIF